ncbi:hypothetical protein ACSX1A_19135 [Pontibacter sp. MBLB2868]|uniref:hypothetical protein n=1 Tax=Pontibacter sp. MBLB2868 TaxID=3451555 RepID=UPI003F753637
MKTLLLALAASTLVAFNSYGQVPAADSTASSSLKPQAKHVATELNINPFNGTISLNNAINQLKFRYFTASNFAIRIGFNGNKTSFSSENTNPYGTNSYRNENERSSTTLGLNLGVEKHFAGTRRLSPYIGADFTIENKSTEQEITEGQVITTIKGGWRDYTYYSNGGYSYSYSERGYTRFGLNVLTGFDFYMAKNLFFGYEMNFGFKKTNNQELDITQTGSNSSTPNNPEIKDSAFSFGPSLMNGIRIGYVF